MRKPIVITLSAVIALLLGATGILYSKYQQASTGYTNLQASEQETKNRYGEAINEIAAIQDSLNAIALGSGKLELETNLSSTSGDDALARIAVIKAGIERTKVRIIELDQELKKSGVKVAGLQKMITNLKKNVTEKEEQVAQLTTRVDSLQTEVTGLVAEVQENQDSIQAQAQVIEDKRRELGTVYYMIGSKKDLKNSGVIAAKGGVLGIAKTIVPTGHVDEQKFTAIDTDQETVIQIPSKKAQVLSAQPTDSYALQLVGNQLELHITNPQEFRKVKHLVIMTT